MIKTKDWFTFGHLEEVMILGVFLSPDNGGKGEMK